MKHRKLFRTVIALLLSLSTVFASSPFALAAAAEAQQRAAFDALPDNAIVCYMYGQPVYKYEVDENGIVHKDFNLNNTSNTRASGSGYTIPTSHRGFVIHAGCTLVTTGFSQTENVAYLPVDEATQIADSFATAASVTAKLKIMNTCLNHEAVSKKMIAMFTGFLKATLEDIAEDMDEILNSGSRVQLCVTTSSYGQFCAVDTWNGTSCVRYGYTNDTTTYTVNSVICDGCGSSVWS